MRESTPAHALTAQQPPAAVTVFVHRSVQRRPAAVTVHGERVAPTATPLRSLPMAIALPKRRSAAVTVFGDRFAPTTVHGGHCLWRSHRATAANCDHCPRTNRCPNTCPCSARGRLARRTRHGGCGATRRAGRAVQPAASLRYRASSSNCPSMTTSSGTRAPRCRPAGPSGPRATDRCAFPGDYARRRSDVARGPAVSSEPARQPGHAPRGSPIGSAAWLRSPLPCGRRFRCCLSRHVLRRIRRHVPRQLHRLRPPLRSLDPMHCGTRAPRCRSAHAPLTAAPYPATTPGGASALRVFRPSPPSALVNQGQRPRFANRLCRVA